MITVDISALHIQIAALFRSVHLNSADADRLADSLVQADMWGHSSHGVLRASWYADRLKAKAMDPKAQIKVITDTGPLLHLDGQNGIGQLITTKAVRLAADRARQFGVSCVSVRHSGHFGMAMYFTKMLADQNMIGFLATNASPAMPAYGGVEKLVGNNPQSWAAPTDRNMPFIIDISHTAVARGKIYLARDKNEPIPENWALAPDGTSTTDPSQAILGSLLPMAGHKGFGLSAMMDVLSGILSASSFGTEINGPYVPDAPSGVGHFIIAVDITKLRDIADFKQDMEHMISMWKQSQHAQGSEGIFYPGEREYLHEQLVRQNGLTLPEKTLHTLVSTARALHLDVSLDDFIR